MIKSKSPADSNFQSLILLRTRIVSFLGALVFSFSMIAWAFNYNPRILFKIIEKPEESRKMGYVFVNTIFVPPERDSWMVS